MAAFDRRNGQLVVRVVYDGPASVGKTENLKQLVVTFSAQRRGELKTPRARDESTPYFDWLSLNGGVVAGYGLRAQLVTVPGRSELTRRRWQLVKTADVVVFVCESTTRGLKEGRRWLELLRVHLRAGAHEPPVIVQANKQDVEGAIPPEEVARALGLPADAEVVAAVASKGTGVRETIVRAIRAAASLAERELLSRGENGMPDADDDASLLAELDGSAQMRAAIEAEAELPPFPDEDAASGCVWPGTTGRTVLRALARALASSGVARADGDAAPGAIVLRVGDLRLVTSAEQRHPDVQAGRVALLDLARARVRIGSLHAPDTTLVLATAEDGGAWLWTVSPRRETLRERLDDPATAATAVRAYARALAEATLLAVRDRLELGVEPRCFALDGDRVVYIGDRFVTLDEGAAGGAPGAFLDRVTDAARRRRSDALVEALDAALAEKGPLLEPARAAILRELEREPSKSGRPQRSSLIWLEDEEGA